MIFFITLFRYFTIVLFFTLHFFSFSQGMQTRERAHCARSVFPFIKKKKNVYIYIYIYKFIYLYYDMFIHVSYDTCMYGVEDLWFGFSSTSLPAQFPMSSMVPPVMHTVEFEVAVFCKFSGIPEALSASLSFT